MLGLSANASAAFHSCTLCYVIRQQPLTLRPLLPRLCSYKFCASPNQALDDVSWIFKEGAVIAVSEAQQGELRSGQQRRAGILVKHRPPNPRPQWRLSFSNTKGQNWRSTWQHWVALPCFFSSSHLSNAVAAHHDDVKIRRPSVKLAPSPSSLQIVVHDENLATKTLPDLLRRGLTVAGLRPVQNVHDKAIVLRHRTAAVPFLCSSLHLPCTYPIFQVFFFSLFFPSLKFCEKGIEEKTK